MVQVVGTEALHLKCVPGLPRLLDTVHSGQDSLVRSLASQLCGICAMGIALIKCTSCLSH